MIETKQVMDLIPDHIIQKALEDHRSKQTNYPDMNINFPEQDIVEAITDYASEVLGRKVEHRSGNYYTHTIPYLPHTDWFSHLDNNINVLIPLEYDCKPEAEPYLVIFDQIWPHNGVTWCMHSPVLDIPINIGVKGYPGEYPILNKTGRAIHPDFWWKYLSWMPYHLFRNLSGNAYKFEPGSILVFENKKIHCTSYYEGVKTGLSLRFRYADV